MECVSAGRGGQASRGCGVQESHTAPEPIVVHSGSCPSDTRSEHVAIGRERKVDKAGLPHAAPAGEKAHVEDTRTGRVCPTRDARGPRKRGPRGWRGGRGRSRPPAAGFLHIPNRDPYAPDAGCNGLGIERFPPTPKSHSDAVTEVKPQHGSLCWGWWEGAQPARETAVGMISKGMFIIFLLRPGKVT